MTAHRAHVAAAAGTVVVAHLGGGDAVPLPGEQRKNFGRKQELQGNWP
jgi:hypothetical protein